MERYCNNCGYTGHYYRECNNPIMSYGLILYDDTDKGNIKIVMIERKNTISFIEFLRGKYNIDDNNYIQKLFNRMNINEKKEIIKYDFDRLWNDLWIDISQINNRVKKEYEKSKINFNIIKNKEVFNLKYFRDNCSMNYSENEWELPKGRRNTGELNKVCAIREFTEETNITPDKYKLINNLIPLTEEYKGINNVNYKHIYYIGKINNYEKLFINHKNPDQYKEIKSIRWLNKKECLDKIRCYSISKINLIQTFFNFFEKMDNVYIK